MTPKHPHPVPAVRLIVVDAQGRLLALQRAAKSYMGGAWTLPGGKIDYGESPEAAARRELREETGLEARALRFLFWVDSPPLEPGAMHAINFYYECRVDGEMALGAAESSAAAWLAPEDARCDGLVFGGAEAVKRWREEDGLRSTE